MPGSADADTPRIGTPRAPEAYEVQEVVKHNTAKSLWLIINEQVYDVTTYHKRHPGGAAVMLQMAGKDATSQALAAHAKSKKPEQIMKRYLIGTVKGPSRVMITQGDSSKPLDLADIEENPIHIKKSVDAYKEEQLDVVENRKAGKFDSNIVRDEFVEVLSGEDAMVATADFLYQRLRLDKRVLRFMNGNNNLRQLAMRLRFFLAGAFEDPVWPEMRVRDSDIAVCVDDLADVLAEALRMPLPLGEDPLCAALTNVTSDEEWRTDPRINRFFRQIHTMQNSAVEGDAQAVELAEAAKAAESAKAMEAAEATRVAEVALAAKAAKADAERKAAEEEKARLKAEEEQRRFQALEEEARTTANAEALAKLETARKKAEKWEEARRKVSAEQAAIVAKAVEAAKVAEVLRHAEAVEAAHVAEVLRQAEAAKVAEAAKAAEVLRHAEAAVEIARAIEAAKVAEAEEAEAAVEIARVIEAAKVAEAAKAVEIARVIEAAKSSTPEAKASPDVVSSLPVSPGQRNRRKSLSSLLAERAESTPHRPNEDEVGPASPKPASNRSESFAVPPKDATSRPHAVDESPLDAASGIESEKFDELQMDSVHVTATKDAWNLFLSVADSKEAAGEAIFTAIFEGFPSLQSLFQTPKAVQAMRFIESLQNFVNDLDKPAKLKVSVETLAFGHLQLDMTVPRVIIFRDSIMDLLMLELGERFSKTAKEGWMALLSYVGGALIYVKVHYMGRINILLSSWHTVNSSGENLEATSDNDSQDSGNHSGNGSNGPKISSSDVQGNGQKKASWRQMLGSGKSMLKGSTGKTLDGDIDVNAFSATKLANTGKGQTSIPKTYKEMFFFNAAVMGFGANVWFQDALSCFDNIVLSVQNSGRLQEECQVLALRISKFVQKGDVRLADYKACMLASLRSLLPKDWSPAHEVAWTWLWEIVERILEANMHNPPRFEKHLGKLWQESLDDEAKYALRKDIYSVFFVAAPAGQNYFKQSNTRLHFIAEKVCEMTLEMYQDPVKMVDDLAGLGLRHVGFAIPIDLFGPFVTSCIEVINTVTKDETAQEAFRWSLGLIAKMLVRTITEGSTIVMKAVNANSVKNLKSAIREAPRGERTQWMLEVKVGTQHISPLLWAIETGRLDAARAMIEDILTIRADRERYYYGMEDIFRHLPDLVAKLCGDAPSLFPVLLEGLVWRSRLSENGLRRVNSYVKYFIINHEGNFATSMKAIVSAQDPKIMSEGIIVLVSDTLWTGLVRTQFLMRKMWFILSLLCFMLSQAILPNLELRSDLVKPFNIAIFVLRVITHCGQTRGSAVHHGKKCYKEFRKGHEDWPTEFCRESADVQGRYEVFSMCAMTIHWFLLADMCVFSTGLSAFVLVCGHVMEEVAQFLIGLSFLLMTFASAMSALRHDHLQFRDVPNCLLTLFSITVMRYEGDYREINDEPVLLGGVFLFVLASSVLLLNLLIAQLNCSYEYVYQDMVGFARLNRAACIVDILNSCSKKKFKKYTDTLGLFDPLEFNEGDVGMAGGLASSEPASAHPTVEDSIHRYGGSCSPTMKWHDEDSARDHEEDRFVMLEKLIHKVNKRMAQTARNKGGDDEHGQSSKESGMRASGSRSSSEGNHSDDC